MYKLNRESVSEVCTLYAGVAWLRSVLPTVRQSITVRRANRAEISIRLICEIAILDVAIQLFDKSSNEFSCTVFNASR